MQLLPKFMRASGGNKSESPKKLNRLLINRLIRLVGIILGSIMGLLLLLCVLLEIFMSPRQLTPLVTRTVNEYLQAEVRFDTVELTLFRTFPRVGLRLKKGEVVSRAYRDLPDSLRAEVPSWADTLLRFDEFFVSLNVERLLGGRLAFGRVELTRPEIYAYVSPRGVANWEIMAVDTTQTDTTQMELPPITLRRLMIRDGVVHYNSRPDSMEACVEINQLMLKYEADKTYEIDLRTNNTLTVASLAYCRALPVSLSGGVRIEEKGYDRFEIKQLTLGVDDLQASFEGSLRMEGDSIHSDVQCALDAMALQSLLRLAPEQLAPLAKAVNTDVRLQVNASLKGVYVPNPQRLPSLEVTCKIDRGYLLYRDTNGRIDRLLVDALMRYNPNNQDSTGVYLHRLEVDGSGVKIRAAGQATNIFVDPAVRGNLSAEVDLDTLAAHFPSPQGIMVQGMLGVDASGDFRLSQLNLLKIGGASITSSLKMNKLHVEVPSDTLCLIVPQGELHFGVNGQQLQRDSIIDHKTSALYVQMNLDSVHLEYKSFISMVGSKITLNARSATSTLSDTTRVHPMSGEVTARTLKLSTVDSTWIRMQKGEILFTLLPSPSDPTIPKIRLRTGARNLTARGNMNHYRLNGANLDVEATLVPRRNTPEIRARMAARLDSLERVYPMVARDSLFAHAVLRRPAKSKKDDFYLDDPSFKVNEKLSDLMRRWSVRGTIRAKGGRVTTPYFPLRNQLRNVDVTFSTNEILLRNTVVRSGSTHLNLHGRIYNLQRALAGRGPLKADLKIHSDSLIFNQLVQAGNAGFSLLEQGDSMRTHLSEASDEDHLERMMAQQTGDVESGSALLVIPANLEMNIDLSVDTALYADLRMSELSGQLSVRDRCLQINNFKAVTDAGEMLLTALYATRSREDITIGFDLEMKRMHIERLIALAPAVDTLLPMLRSLEGVVDCQMAATAMIDTSMNIILPSLNAACRLHGDQLVLLDGETFTEISKMLRFKNKKRNVINHISVEMLVRDSRAELFPFVLEMDRYRAAVSGIQHLDLSFDYHISVLHSPIPFRLGVDISGTPDKFKFRIGRARYKSADVPSYVELIDSTRLNLRHTITDIFQKGLESAAREELLPMPKITLPVETTAPVEPLTEEEQKLLSATPNPEQVPKQ